ncbi:MAG: Holliday junction resolvase RuvX [Chloroflexi bacterium]|nr:Holliday junction resolvase RuvX [Chloroflexota bacterium]
MRILAVDPGEKRIGIALSDPTATIASRLTVIDHISRAIDAAVIAGMAAEHQAGMIVVGQAFDDDGNPSSQGRRAARLAEAIRCQTSLSVQLWDESSTTQTAHLARQEMGLSRRAKRQPVDDLAAVVLLQSYLEAHRKSPEEQAT